MKSPLRTSALLLAAAAALCFAGSAFAQGRMTKRAAPPRPATGSNGCVVEDIRGSSVTSFKIKRRAEDKARDDWKHQAEFNFGRAFAKWDLANPYTKSLECRSFGKRPFKSYYCEAIAQPCDGSGTWLYRK